MKPEQVGAIIVSTVSHHIPSPGLSDYLAEELGCPAPATFDISAACAGFCYALTLAESIVRAGHAGKDGFVLIVGVERLSDMTNMDDRGTAFLFGDGAGAAVVGPSDTPAIGPAVWGSKPANVKTIEIQSWTEADKNPTGFPLIQMDGHTVFKWALSEVADHAAEAIDAAGITPNSSTSSCPTRQTTASPMRSSVTCTCPTACRCAATSPRWATPLGRRFRLPWMR